MNSEVSYIGDINGNGDASPVPFRVATPDGIDDDAQEYLLSHDGIEMSDLTNAQGAIIRSATKLKDAAAFEAAPNLAYVVRSGDGHDNIDKPEASAHGVATVNTPGVSSRDVALHANAFITSWARRLMEGSASLRRGQWAKKELKPRELNTLGIIGYGNIGKQAEKISGPLFEKVLRFDALPDRNNVKNIDELLETSTVICIHAAGKQEILTPELLNKIGPGTLLVNTSRGSNVNINGLLARLSADDDFSYATDVFWGEPPNPRGQVYEQIRRHPNFMGTPHIAASRIGNQKDLGRTAVARILEFAQHGTVNPDDIQGHTLPKIELRPREEVGGRVVLLHESKPGKLETIFDGTGDKQMNIQRNTNDQGAKFSGHRLAQTVFDFESDVVPESALKIMRRIESELDAYHTRLLWYAQKPPTA
ncbi:hypothetical protein KKF03_02000 [Patescibacteria group bacterium]|nr:hypothetical protein [Patescibacteria group bacterium]MBU1911358.1 hypothetical protein [Patescibacteria group bacterium]